MKKSYVVLLIVMAISSALISACAIDTTVPVSHYDLAVKYSDEVLEVEENITYYHKGDSTSQLAIMLYPNAYQSIDTLGGEKCVDYFEAGSLKVEGFRLNDVERDYQISGYLDTVLTSTLDEELGKGEQLDIYIKYEVHLPHCNGRLGITQDGVVNLANFYAVVPTVRDGKWAIDDYVYMGDPYVSDLKDMDIRVTIPREYTLAHGAHEVKQTEGEYKTLDMSYTCVRDVAMCISDRYQFTKMQIDGVDISYYYYNDTDYLNTAYVARNCLDYFESKFGEYPYPTYTIAETPLMAGGMEYSGFCVINSHLNPSDREETVVHETAHQWWYNIVGNDNVYEPWIDEGLAEYSTIMYLGEIYGDEWIDSRVYNTQNAYMLFSDLKDKVYNNRNSSINRSIYEYDGSLEYTYLVYLKSMLMHSNLHDLLGDKYVDTLKTLVRDNYMGKIDKKILINTFAKVNNRKMDVVFDAWLEGRVFVLPME